MPVTLQELQIVGDIRSNITDSNLMLRFLEEQKDLMARYGINKLDVALVCKEAPIMIVPKEETKP
jgi:hypothetical protein